MSTSITGAAQVLTPPGTGLDYLRHDQAGELGLAPGALLIDGARIAALQESDAGEIHVDAIGCAIVPGFVDCHTHLPFAGWREREYAQKVAGVAYEEIARNGGGIRASARALREASDDEVLEQAVDLAADMLVHGTTAFEGKSGYGLSSD